MKTWFVVFLTVLSGTEILIAQLSFAEVQKWQQEARYQIEAGLDTTAKRLVGNMLIFYKNNSPDTLRKIFLQVPANAFYDEENTAVREMRRFNISGGSIDFPAGEDYKLTIQSVQFLSIGEQTSFPLQAYDFSDTILDLTLPYSLLPGDTLSLGIRFKQDFTKIGGRSQKETEDSKNVSAVEEAVRKARIPSEFVLWFPRLVVYDEEGWHAEPFHFMMESSDVYSEFAEMDVTITVPGNYILVGSGEIVEGDPGWEMVTADTSMDKKAFIAWHDSIKQQLDQKGKQDGLRRVRFHANRLHNFIWSASPKYVHYLHNSRAPMHIFYRGMGDRTWLENLLDRIDAVFQYLEEYFGPYSLDHLNIVMSTDRTVAQPRMVLMQNADYFDLAYELSGIYFPGIVASNGVKESWLAKGLRIYMGKSYSEKIYGKRGYELEEAQEDMSWLERQYPLPSLDELLRNFTHLYMDSGQNESISKEIYKYKDPIGALFNLYLKSDLFYEMLQFVVGDSVFKASLREVVRRHVFTHVRESDLLAAFEDVYGQDLVWFFDQWLHGTPTVDYKKERIRKYKRDDNTWVTEVEVKRRGDGIMPVEVELDLGEGQKIVKRWDGKKTSGKVMFETAKKPKGVRVDPDDRIMDSNRLNNQRPRLEFRPDWPLLKYIHMPGDAILVLWRPLIGYNKHDSVRLGFRTRSSYRAFYNNLTLEAMFGFESKELDGKIAYSHPLNRKSLLNRYYIMARKNEGRFEADVHLELKGSKGIISASSRNLEIGFNFSGLLNSAYTFRRVANDTGKVRFDEWEDLDILQAYVGGKARFGSGKLDTEAGFRLETALPGGDAQFTKLSGRLEAEYQVFGFKGKVRGNLATSFGPDRLPLQDQFRAEGAGPRARFQNDLVKTGDALSSFSHRNVEGGGFLRGYAGLPLPAERFATINLELGPSKSFFVFKLFGFYDTGRIWKLRDSKSVTRSDAGFGISFLGNKSAFFGGNLALLSNLSAKLFFPIWLSNPPPGEKEVQFRWYFSLGKGL